ncbi:hypothetical protein BCR39DRAFT_506382 [Naematelia encephala]|uniref:Uncharacterized protein n=1 Tax=Naematelia encephala TaxID=71784 RepID=A0A1Y2AX95_9TREE|nr:hypothetical protein BCR39DRAFT_506382 [Naematelia encephala]
MDGISSTQSSASLARSSASLAQSSVSLSQPSVSLSQPSTSHAQPSVQSNQSETFPTQGSTTHSTWHWEERRNSTQIKLHSDDGEASVGQIDTETNLPLSLLTCMDNLYRKSAEACEVNTDDDLHSTFIKWAGAHLWSLDKRGIEFTAEPEMTFRVNSDRSSKNAGPVSVTMTVQWGNGWSSGVHIPPDPKPDLRPLGIAPGPLNTDLTGTLFGPTMIRDSEVDALVPGSQDDFLPDPRDRWNCIF